MLNIREYHQSDFDQLCKVMDKARMQELKSENLTQIFLSLKDASYLEYFLACNIHVAVKQNRIVGFVGLRPHKLSFLYVDPAF